MSRYVLTIQSHVAYGFVGNSAAVFPLQLLGFSPIVVNTVEFSNHTGHPTFRGQVFTAELIRDIILGIRERGLIPKIEGLLSGYLGDASIGKIVLELATEIKAANPNAVWLCDPVMGDTDTGVFVRPDIPQFMKEHFLNGLADLTKPKDEKPPGGSRHSAGVVHGQGLPCYVCDKSADTRRSCRHSRDLSRYQG